MNKQWAKIDIQDNGSAYLLTTSKGVTRAFSDMERALGFAEGFLGVPLERFISMLGEVTFYGEYEYREVRS
jgi:hypothetical protein